jgi:AcrR family transcriptional regulator
LFGRSTDILIIQSRLVNARYIESLTYLLSHVYARFGRPIDTAKAGRAMTTTAPDTRTQLLAAGKTALLESGYAALSTRRIAEAAGVPLSQIHYHFGSRQNLVLAVLDDENARLLERQSRLYGAEMPVWRQWEQACDFLEDDLRSGYVRVLQEMTAAGWSDAKIADMRRKLNPDIMEMESAAIAQVCAQLRTPCIVFRAGSNRTQSNPGNDYRLLGQKAAYAAARWTVYFTGCLAKAARK